MAQLQEHSTSWSFGEFYRDEPHDREQLRLAARRFAVRPVEGASN